MYHSKSGHSIVKLVNYQKTVFIDAIKDKTSFSQHCT